MEKYYSHSEIDNELLKKLMVGKTFKDVYASEDELVFRSDNNMLKFYHSQCCCEDVYIEDICGDLEDLINTPILLASVETQEGTSEEAKKDYCTWTFYKFSTIKGDVTVRWYGTSNGYYSEEVDLIVTEEV